MFGGNAWRLGQGSHFDKLNVTPLCSSVMGSTVEAWCRLSHALLQDKDNSPVNSGHKTQLFHIFTSNLPFKR